MKRALVIASVASMIDQFNMPNIRLMQELGYQVDVACNFEQGSTCTDEKVQQLKKTLTEMNVVFYQIDFTRNILKVGDHFRAVRQLKAIARKNHYDMMHCHSPIGGLLGRLVFRKYRKQGTRVIYTAHGFHFFKGAPLKNWFVYYPAEKICSYFTDLLITINQEDFVLARKRMKAKRVEYVPGVGIDLQKFSGMTVDIVAKRKELGIPQNGVWLLNIGELIPRKNQAILINSVAALDNVYLTIAGRGVLAETLAKQIQTLNVGNRIQLLGYRTDIAELCSACDIFAFPSFHEGLSVAVMEAMASGLPVACSRIRGNTDLIDAEGGVMFDPHSEEECKSALEKILQSDFEAMGQHNAMNARNYDINSINERMKEIYQSV